MEYIIIGIVVLIGALAMWMVSPNSQALKNLGKKSKDQLKKNRNKNGDH